MDRPADSATAHEALTGVLREYWGYDSFRPLQQQAMAAVLAGRDSLVVLPTGGGKSLCYQAPALALPGVAVVVSPLIALMKDQVDTLRANGVPAAFINSSLTAEERRQVTDDARQGKLKLLYAAPERLVREYTLAFLRSIDVSFVAIDEAHCVSTWGHDFRPEYTCLGQLKQALPGVAMHAYTATAADRVQQDIAVALSLHDPELLIGPFDRPNLVYRVRRANKKLTQIQEVIDRNTGESGIVYCISRNEVEDVAASLKSAGVRAAPYHAGMSDTARARNQDGFLADRIDVIVATIAFGMGIDKPNVRFVTHAGMPKSLEAYVQESGRAGRDGLESECLLLYKGSDPVLWRRMIDEGEPAARAGALRSLDEMVQFSVAVGCRHRAIVEYFGQRFDRDNCGACDFCLAELQFADDPLVNSQKIISCVARLEQRFGASHTAKVLSGSKDQNVTKFNHTALSTYGILRHEQGATIRDWIEQLVGQGHLQKVGDYGVLQITASGREVLRGKTTPQLLAPAKQAKASRGRTEANWNGVDRGLFDTLRTLRATLAAKKSAPAYVVFGDATLREMARRRPTSIEALALVRGVGTAKLRDYGPQFLEAIVTYCSQIGIATDVQ